MRKSRALVKYRGRYGPRNVSIKILLKQLGLPRNIWCVRSFWEHWSGQLEYVLYDAEKVYKRHAVRVHPRKETDDQEESKALNSLWMTIKERIKFHMHPSLISNSRWEPRKQLKPPKGFIQRTCQALHCGKIFYAKSRRVHYCCRSHMFAAMNARRYKEKKRERRRILVKCAFSKCGSLFWRFADLKKRRFCSPKCCQYSHCYEYVKRNRAKINQKQRDLTPEQRKKRNASTRLYQKEHQKELGPKKAAWKRKWRKKLKAQREALPIAQPEAKL